MTLVLVLHSHQPVGNLDWSVQFATDKAYRPFLQVLSEYPELTCCLHYSGSLLEWFVEHAPEMITGIREVVARGQVELIGGAFYDPILTMLPEPDIHGQITAFREYLAETFGQSPRGAWVAERVWEQSLTRSLVDAGVEYISLDDSHFLHAGLTDRELVGGFLTEDDGRLLRVYPASEELRYRIPFQEPEKTIEYLARLAEQDKQRLVVYADDGEKFGSWPETYAHVYTNGWLRRFIETLLNNRDWIHLATLAEATDRFPAVGKIYLPDGSYREMTEWALPASRQAEYEGMVDRLKHEGRYEELKPFLKMGFWRNFKAKYREANLLYAKSLAVSRKVNQLLSAGSGRQGAPGARGAAALLQQARQELYRGQCNCPYWHGVFGGLYLPHLRSAAYSKLIAAEAAADRLLHRGDSWAELSEADFDLDGHHELLLANRMLWLGIAPERGGHLFELDLRAEGAGRAGARQPDAGAGIFFNLTNSLTRRWEAYHRKVAQPAGAGAESTGSADEVKTIHEIVAVKEPGLEKKLRYDRYERESLVDHCLPLGVTLEQVEAGQYEELADLVSSPYQVVERHVPRPVSSGRGAIPAGKPGRGTCLRVRLARQTALRTAGGPSGSGPLLVEKEIALPLRGGELTAGYELRNLADEPASFTFAVEWNFSLLAGNAPDRYYFLPRKSPEDQEGRLGPLVSRHSLSAEEHVGLRDEWTGMELLLSAPGAAGWFLFPCESVSQSESGLELVYQSSCVMPYWAVDLARGASTRFQMGLAVRALATG